MVLAFFGFAEWIEGLGIAAAVFIATFVSTYSEYVSLNFLISPIFNNECRYKNEASFQELQRKASQVMCNVFRNGKDLQEIPIDEIVVNDFVLLESGSIVPADGILASGSVLVCKPSVAIDLMWPRLFRFLFYFFREAQFVIYVNRAFFFFE
jgi:magnesium-transporting ATPase (P-type)